MSVWFGLFALLFSSAQSTSFTIHTDTVGPGNSELIAEYLSITMPSGTVNYWNEFGFNNTLVNTLAKGLVPVFMRYGGTSQDQVTYNITQPITMDNNNNNNVNYGGTPPYTLTSEKLSTLADFVIQNKWQWIFGLNAQKRTNITSNNPTGVWDSNNAESLISSFLASNNPNISNIFYAFELANEPDSYVDESNFQNVTAIQLANDFYILYNLLNNLYNNKEINKNNVKIPQIFGCDISRQFGYLGPFLNECSIISANNNMKSKPYLDGITWHHYYGDSANYTLNDFISVKVLDSLIDYLTNAIATGHDSNSYPIFDNTPIMLGETSSTYGGGSSNLSSSFVGGFLWLDKLGLSSIYGLYSIMRQDFWHAEYALIGVTNQDFYPNPDYWSSLLFKTLVGQFGKSKTLNVDNEFDTGRDIRVYAFCTNVANDNDNDKLRQIWKEKEKDIGYNFTMYENGSITLLILNVQNNTIEFNINLDPTPNTYNNNNNNSNNMYYDQYFLTSYPNVLNSRDIFLNGKHIKMVDNSTFPALTGVTKQYGSTIEMPALSYGFVVVANAQASACM